MDTKFFDVYFLEGLEVMEKHVTSVLCPEDGSSRFLRNIHKFPQAYAAFNPKHNIIFIQFHIAVLCYNEVYRSTGATNKSFHITVYNPPDYSIGRHVFLSGILSVLSGGTVNLLILVTMNFISINSRF